jgi:hydroxymethylbilane synthase
MRKPGNIIRLATRGSGLALAQANLILNQCRAAFPYRRFELNIIKTTGDKLASASLARGRENLPKGLFTKELEVALLGGDADLAVHSLKDLPTELPPGLKLGAVTQRADPRDVLIYRAKTMPGPVRSLHDLPGAAVIGTSSTRRRAQLLAQKPDLQIVELRGNIITRLQKLGRDGKMFALVLAAAGLERMNFHIVAGRLTSELIPDGLAVLKLDPKVMLPCVGQGALGIECRDHDPEIDELCAHLNDAATNQCVTAERSFLAGMGGGCASPVAAYARLIDHELHMRALSFPDGIIRCAEGKASPDRALELGKDLAARLKNRPVPEASPVCEPT